MNNGIHRATRELELNCYNSLHAPGSALGDRTFTLVAHRVDRDPQLIRHATSVRLVTAQRLHRTFERLQVACV